MIPSLSDNIKDEKLIKKYMRHKSRTNKEMMEDGTIAFMFEMVVEDQLRNGTSGEGEVDIKSIVMLHCG